VRYRLSRPAETLRLVAARIVLTLDDHELGLDYDPTLDRNPARPTLRLGFGRERGIPSFGMLLGLAVAGLVLRGFRGTGRWPVWGAILACAVIPLAFYVSSRYRLPLAALLCIPAGCGLVGLLQSDDPQHRSRRSIAWLAAAGTFALSLAMPLLAEPLAGYSGLRRTVMAQGLAMRAAGWVKVGEIDRGERVARSAVDLAPGEASVRRWLGIVVEASGDLSRAEAIYRESMELAPPGRAQAATNLSGLLVRRGAASEAVGVLRRALEWQPANENCWNNLVVALFESGDREGALDAVEQAGNRGIVLNPELVRTVLAGAAREGDGGSPVEVP
jgi:hypothetical protein